MIFTRKLSVLSTGEFYSTIITDLVREIVKESGVQEGVALVFYQHTTGSVVIAEHETGILVDLEDMLEKILPIAGDYAHHRRGHDLNGASHIRSALLGVSVHVPVIEGDLRLGTYQELILLDMDHGQKERTVVIQVIGE